MDFISTSTLRSNLADALKVIKKKKDLLLVSNRGKVVAGLINPDLLEDLLELKDKDYVKSIKKSREEFEEGDVYSHEEAFGKL